MDAFVLPAETVQHTPVTLVMTFPPGELEVTSQRLGEHVLSENLLVELFRRRT